jgi:hypothetical protein
LPRHNACRHVHVLTCSSARPLASQVHHRARDMHRAEALG